MTARCTICGRVWNISIRQNPHGYICPDCEYRARLKAASALKEAIKNHKRKEKSYETA